MSSPDLPMKESTRLRLLYLTKRLHLDHPEYTRLRSSSSPDTTPSEIQDAHDDFTKTESKLEAAINGLMLETTGIPFSSFAAVVDRNIAQAQAQTSGDAVEDEISGERSDERTRDRLGRFESFVRGKLAQDLGGTGGGEASEWEETEEVLGGDGTVVRKGDDGGSLPRGALEPVGGTQIESKKGAKSGEEGESRFEGGAKEGAEEANIKAAGEEKDSEA
ncbi:hypothetical protein M409DRAFT_28101 [Zasmidium cellare ATCC 36951]|uniref:Uncharacterized protein n=1 Tax=Zasmidium cellare ATCC 36951 TaxID=1080233 RepID=A0A6A6C7K1_ZASCE|nr:uncharacterized protein M409DRAFT_28101 [Zasmidium cellare ATCC 36951]KAF2161366.1 hypothetical protein M409DRAFT_28101 [Zasmidium cellare ATCC 36951]